MKRMGTKKLLCNLAGIVSILLSGVCIMSCTVFVVTSLVSGIQAVHDPFAVDWTNEAVWFCSFVIIFASLILARVLSNVYYGRDWKYGLFVSKRS